MEAVELILYELRPKWCKIAEVIWKDCGGYMVTRAKMPFLGRTLCRGPTISTFDATLELSSALQWLLELVYGHFDVLNIKTRNYKVQLAG